MRTAEKMRKMSKKLKVSVLVLLALCLMMPSCKKDDQACGCKKDTSAKTCEKDTKKCDAAPKGQTKNGGDQMVALPFELPKPMFEGTPQNIKVANLEKPRSEPRPPMLAPKGATNLAAGKPVTGSDDEPIIGDMEYITDGDKAASDGSYVELAPGKQYITIDIGEECNIYAILFWHFHKQARVYFDVVVQVADDPDFIENVHTLFNNDIDNSAGLGVGKDMHYVETNEGKLIDAKGVKARYVRLYSNGSNQNELNHYIEVEVWGKPVK